MSTVVDKRIVEMDFDNSDFESNVKTSLSTLDRLKMALGGLPASVDFGGVASVSDSIQNGLTNSFQNVANNVHGIFAKIGNTILTDTVLQWKRGIENIVEQASIQQIAAGWGKYAEKTSSVQTIMAATKQAGESEEEAMARVNTQLEKLMWFSDETSYSFNDMVNNIGKFTSQGIELDKATNAMMGISNWAAVSGAGVSEASRAMYNLSQALALGSVRLMDWKSIENANMATKEFKEMVIDSALAMGTLEKAADGSIYAVGEAGKKTAITFQNMSQTLTEGADTGWFNNEVLMDVLGKYSAFAEAVYEIHDDYDTAAEAMADMDTSAFSELAIKAFKAAQEAKTFKEAVEAVYDAASSQWSAIFEKIFGDYLNAKVVWTDLANWMWDVFAEPLDVLNGVLDLWNNINEVDPTIIGGTGSFYLIQGLTNILETGLELLTLFRESYRDAVGTAAEVALGLYKASQSFYDITLKVSGFVERHSEQISRAFKILTAPIRLITSLVKAFFEEFSAFNQNSGIGRASEDILDLAANIGDYVDNMVTAIEESEIFNKVFKTLFGIIKSGIDIVKNLVSYVGNSKLFNAILEGVEKIGQTLGSIFVSFFEFTSGSTEGLGGFINDIASAFGRLGDAAAGPLSWLFDILEKIFGSIGNFFTNKWNSISTWITDIPVHIQNISDKISGLWNKLKEFFDTISQGFNEFFKGTKDDADGNLPIGHVVDEMADASAEANKIDFSFLDDLNVDITKIATSFNALLGVGSISGSISTTGLVAVLAAFIIFNKIINIIKEFTDKGNPLEVIDKLTDLPDKWLNLVEGFQKLADNMIKTTMKPLKILAWSVFAKSIISAIGAVALEFAFAMAIMALIPSDKFSQVTGFMAEMFGVLFTVLTYMNKILNGQNLEITQIFRIQKIVSTLGLAMLEIGGAIVLMAVAGWIFSKSENGWAALGGVFGFLLEIFGYLAVLKQMNYSVEDASAVAILSLALDLLGWALIEIAAAGLLFSQINENGITGISFTLLAIIGIIGLAKLVNFGPEDAAGVLIASLAMGVLGFAMIEFAAAGLLFNQVSEEGITRLLLALAGMTIAAGVLGFVASKLNPAAIGPILALGVLMGVMAISMIAFAGACMIFSKVDWEDIGKAGAVLLGVVVALAIFVALAAGLSSVGPMALGVIAGFVGLMLSIAVVVGAVGLSIWLIVKGIEGFIAAFETLSQMNISTEEIDKFISNFAEILKSFGEAFVNAGWSIMEFILDGLNNFLAKNATAIFTLAVTIIDILAEGIIKVGPKILEALNNLIKVFMMLTPALSLLFISLRTMATLFFAQLLAMLIDWITMSLQAIEDRAEEWGNKAALIISHFYIGFINGLNEMSEDIIDDTFKFILGFIEDLTNALDEYGPQLKEKGVELFKEFMEMMFEGEEALGQIGTSVASAAWHIIEGLVDGLTNFKALDTLGGAAWTLGQTLISKFMESTQEHSPSKVFEKLGGFIPEGVAIGIKEKTVDAVDAMKDSADSLLSPMKDSISSLFTDLNGEDMNPVISPILDLTNVEDGMGDLSSYFNSDNFNLSGSYSAKASSASSSGFSSGSSSDLNNMFASLMDKLNTNSSQFKGMAETPVNVNVMLEGDTKKIFQVVQRENSKFKLSTGHGGF